jgi:hypothetical protein
MMLLGCLAGSGQYLPNPSQSRLLCKTMKKERISAVAAL